MPLQTSKLCDKCKLVLSSHWCSLGVTVHTSSAHGVDYCHCDCKKLQLRDSENQLLAQCVFQRQNAKYHDEPGHHSPEHHTILGLEDSAPTCYICLLLHDQVRRRLRELRQEGFSSLDLGLIVGYVQPTRIHNLNNRFHRHALLVGDYYVSTKVNWHLKSNRSRRNLRPIFTCEIELHAFTGDSTSVFQPKEIGDVLEAPVIRRSAQIRSWMAVCNTKHEDCHSLNSWMSSPTKLPTRLLQLTSRDNKPKAKLVDTVTMGEKALYASLSHRWGDAQPLSLLQSNEESLREEVPFWSLPRTFQDAIELCLSIDIPYLWIDTLCIIQDSHDDWLSEASRMCDVYSNCSLNIAATSASDGAGGLFSDDRFVQSPLVNVSWTGRLLTSGLFVAVDASAWEAHVEHAPLNSRAWVLQERILAPRTVHFAYDQMWWSCTGLPIASEQMPTGEYLPKYREGPMSLRWSDPPQDVSATRHSFKKLFQKPSNQSLAVWHSSWLELIRKYTLSTITYESDRPVALAGVAEAVAKIQGMAPSDYLAGIWYKHMLVSLLWVAGNTSQRLFESKTPTWSWLSVGGAVFPNNLNHSERSKVDLLITLVNAQTVPVAGPFGPVSGGYVTLEGPLMKLHPSTFWHRSTVDGNTEPGIGIFKASTPVTCDQELERSLWIGWARLDDAGDRLRWPDNEKELFYACFVALGNSSHSKSVSTWSTEGLLLERAGTGPDRYLRVGKMDLTSFGDYDKYLDRYRQNYTIY